MPWIFARLRSLEKSDSDHAVRLSAAESKIMSLETQEAALAAQITTIATAVDTIDGHLSDQQTQIAALQAEVNAGSTGAELQPLIDQLTATNAKAQAAIAALPTATPAPTDTTTPTP